MNIISRYFKKTPISTHIFRGILLLILTAGIVATFVLHDYLYEFFGFYEDSRPKHLAETYFNEIIDENNA